MEPAEGHVHPEEREDGDEKGADENAAEEYYGFRPICRLAWHGTLLAVARFSQLQVYSAKGPLAQTGQGPVLPIANPSGALINSIQWSEGKTSFRFDGNSCAV